jgi:hypothetical protein
MVDTVPSTDLDQAVWSTARQFFKEQVICADSVVAYNTAVLNGPISIKGTMTMEEAIGSKSISVGDAAAIYLRCGKSEGHHAQRDPERRDPDPEVHHHGRRRIRLAEGQ